MTTMKMMMMIFEKVFFSVFCRLILEEIIRYSSVV